MIARRWIVSALLAAAAAAAGGTAHASAPLACDGKGPAARNFVLRDVDNRKWTFGPATKGKVVLVDFWATWCAPCKVEIPGFVDLHRRYKAAGLEVVGVSMDTDLAAIKSFAAEFGVTYPILIGAGADGVTRAWGVEGLPTTVLVTREGKVCRTFVGQTPKEEFEALVGRLLATSVSSPTRS